MTCRRCRPSEITAWKGFKEPRSDSYPPGPLHISNQWLFIGRYSVAASAWRGKRLIIFKTSKKISHRSVDRITPCPAKDNVCFYLIFNNAEHNRFERARSWNNTTVHLNYFQTKSSERDLCYFLGKEIRASAIQESYFFILKEIQARAIREFHELFLLSFEAVIRMTFRLSGKRFLRIGQTF